MHPPFPQQGKDMNTGERSRALKWLLVMALLVILAQCAGCAWTPASRYYCPHIIPQEQYDRLLGLSTISVLPTSAYNELCALKFENGCRHTPLAFTSSWANLEGRITRAEIYIPERLAEDLRPATHFHEVCHLHEMDSGVSDEDSAAHVGWIEPKGLHRTPAVRVLATLP
jgi:hypothetical protein